MYVVFLQTLVALKRTGCDVWQMECQASNVTANVQSDHLLHGYILPVFLATDQLHRLPGSAEIQSMSQQDAFATRTSVSRICKTYSIRVKNEKDQKSVDFTTDRAGWCLRRGAVAPPRYEGLGA